VVANMDITGFVSIDTVSLLNIAKRRPTSEWKAPNKQNTSTVTIT
jgi:hypothetical protein